MCCRRPGPLFCASGGREDSEKKTKKTPHRRADTTKRKDTDTHSREERAELGNLVGHIRRRRGKKIERDKAARRAKRRRRNVGDRCALVWRDGEGRSFRGPTVTASQHDSGSTEISGAGKGNRGLACDFDSGAQRPTAATATDTTNCSQRQQRRQTTPPQNARSSENQYNNVPAHGKTSQAKTKFQATPTNLKASTETSGEREKGIP